MSFWLKSEHLRITYFRGKSPILAGLIRKDQNIGRFSINSEAVARVDLEIPGF